VNFFEGFLVVIGIYNQQ